MRRLTILTCVAIFAMALIGCESTANNTVKTNGSMMNANSNLAVVVNNNSPVVANANMGGTMNNNNSTWNAGITREEYDKGKEDFATKAKSAGSTIGSGANDGWLWTKTKSALATANDLRDSTINVDVDNAVITLKGTVATKAESDKALAIAKGIDGQKGIKNELKVAAGDSMMNMNGNTKPANMKK